MKMVIESRVKDGEKPESDPMMVRWLGRLGTKTKCCLTHIWAIAWKVRDAQVRRK